MTDHQRVFPDHHNVQAAHKATLGVQSGQRHTQRGGAPLVPKLGCCRGRSGGIAKHLQVKTGTYLHRQKEDGSPVKWNVHRPAHTVKLIVWSVELNGNWPAYRVLVSMTIECIALLFVCFNQAHSPLIPPSAWPYDLLYYFLCVLTKRMWSSVSTVSMTIWFIVLLLVCFDKAYNYRPLIPHSNFSSFPSKVLKIGWDHSNWHERMMINGGHHHKDINAELWDTKFQLLEGKQNPVSQSSPFISISITKMILFWQQPRKLLMLKAFCYQQLAG